MNRLAVILLISVVTATGCEAVGQDNFSTADQDWRGLKFIRDAWNQTKTAGLCWNLYRGQDSCRLAKPPVICTNREQQFPINQGRIRNVDRYQARFVDFGLLTARGNLTSQPETTNSWTRTTLTYPCAGDKQFRVTASRLSPAILLETETGNMNLFAGSGLNFFADDSGRIVSAENTGQTQKLDPASAYLLAWFGAEGGCYAAGPNPDVKTRWDFPVLIVLPYNVEKAIPGTDGSIELSFSGSAAVAVMPLFGDAPVLAGQAERTSGAYEREFGVANVKPTAKWKNGLPETVIDRCQQWSIRLGWFPWEVEETFRYEKQTDTATVESAFTFKPIRPDANKFAPVWPMLSVADWAGLNVNFSARPKKSDLMTSVGPYRLVPYHEDYSYSIKGLGKYVYQVRRYGPDDDVPNELKEEFNRQIDKILDAGITAPWILVRQLTPDGTIPDYQKDSNRLIHGYPGDNIYLLSQFIDAADHSRRAELKKLMKKWQAKYPMLQVKHMPATEDTPRYGYYFHKPRAENWPDGAANFHYIYGLLPAEGIYYYEDYCRTISDYPQILPTDVLEPYLNRMDWATGSSFRWNQHAKTRGQWGHTFRDKDYGWSGTAEANRLFAALVGMIRLAEHDNNSQLTQKSWYFFTRKAITRLAMEKFKYLLYEEGLLNPPANPRDLKYGQGHYHHLGPGVHTFNRKGPEDDPYIIYECDEFGTLMLERRAHYWVSGRLPAYLSMTPELGRFLHDHAQNEVRDYCQTFEESTPDWYIAYGENNQVGEARCLYPETVYQLFCARAWVLDASPVELLRYADLPWIETADMFYIHKLAETVKAFRKTYWQNL